MPPNSPSAHFESGQALTPQLTALDQAVHMAREDSLVLHQVVLFTA